LWGRHVQVNLNVWTHNILTLEARRKAAQSQSECTVQHSGDHENFRWLMASTFVVGYSFGISMSLPFFSTLVGLVTSVCYLTCAYTIPCWFTLRLLGDRISKFERYACYAIIPVSILVSAVGFIASVVALWRNIGGVG
jgi:solute carrier family 32 (vesicular inhibitory amino acid transporter)